MAGEPQERPCDCGTPQRSSADPGCPVEFDSEMNEFHLIHKRMRAVMRYCFWCGGRLPESKRDQFFSEPSESEKREVSRLLKGVKTIGDARTVLGEPDETFDGNETEQGESSLRWKQMLRYSRRWKTLVLSVMEMADGTISYITCGQFTGGPPGTK